MSRSRRFTWWTLGGLLAGMVLAGCAGTIKNDRTGIPPPYPVTIIDLVVGQGPVPWVQKVSRGREESVVWKNSDSRGHTIRFTTWPFREPQQDIYVGTGQISKRFHVFKNQDPPKCSYGVFPPVNGTTNSLPPSKDTGSPDPPAVEVGD